MPDWLKNIKSIKINMLYDFYTLIKQPNLISNDISV